MQGIGTEAGSVRVPAGVLDLLAFNGGASWDHASDPGASSTCLL
jgi:hypothetical protein